MCLEVFLIRIQNKIRGHEFKFAGKTIKSSYLAYADDLVIMLNNQHQDYKILHDELAKLNEVSGLKVNKNKSIFFTNNTEIHTSYPYKNIIDDEIVYLGVNLNQIDWKTFINKIMRQFNINEIHDLPIHLKIQTINSYKLSKAFYHDLIQPMDKKQINYWNKIIKQYFKYISMDTLIARNKQGGFNLNNLEDHLLGQRSKIIYNLLFDETNWNYIELREKVQKFTNQFYPPSRYTMVHWSEILLKKAYHIRGTRKWEIATYFTKKNSTWTKMFNKSEIEYLNAWCTLMKPYREKEEVSRQPYDFDKIEELTTSPIILTDDQQWIYRIENKFFHSISKRIQTEKRKSLCPNNWSYLLNLTQKDWASYFKIIYKAKLKYPKGVETIHRVALGHFTHFGSENSTNLHTCEACYDEVPKHGSFKHLTITCPITKYIWDMLEIPGIERSHQAWIGNPNITIDQLIQINKYLDLVFFYRKRRRTSLGEDNAFSLEFLSRSLKTFNLRYTIFS
ncbi:uncharacterized protein KGF55_004747 [Candida pseudojiufengensis]|uniref:uncharacterized protein n=1 Tax=Candida pseudojiufengensis TaxID=497109 RepID=UPI002224FFE7|nr:uncharacterized protein KGF55_004747 [Candida pseudojiufengensis]KAI5960454.1 hypothetical protein KGF55_004747 [Candida pseudojiufengensis]